MDFRKTEEQELLLEGLREVIARECSEEYIRECYEKHEPITKLNKALIANGFGLLGVPEKFGGTEVDVVTLMLVSEEITKMTGASIAFTGNALQIDDVLTFGSEEQQKIVMDYLLENGNMAFSLGITEPQAGSDNSGLATTVTRKNGKVYINGHKTFISDADRAPYMLTMTRDFSIEPAAKAMSMWFVPMDSPGVKIEKLEKIGTQTGTLCEVYLENVELEEKHLMGKEGQGFIQLMKNFEIERLVFAASSLGLAEAAFEDAARYANQREQFGQKIGSFQLIQEKITNMAIKIENMRNLIYKAAWEKDNGISVQISAALAKLYCAKSSFEVADDAMQIFGGIGYTRDHRVSRIWADSRMARIAGGTDEIMVYIAGRALLKQYSK